ncbi:MAG: Ig-like domain-containing protein [Lewinella sp.]|nr:Ig-like domain-containing protein [Lewinella sp.]
MKRHFWIILGLLVLLGSYCANPIAPQGGPRDETPPQVVPEKSTTNYQTNFRPREIQLTFDEWVKLQDVARQIIISPPLQGYDVRLKGKSVILDLGERDTLRSNATYVIQFGEAVRDLTESNPAEDLRFVFSTGPIIDSLEVQGQVVDAYTGEAVEDALVMLYDNLADTVVRTERPFYFARTDEDGLFLISNVREGNFKLFALEDADANYRFNQATERIAFRPEPLPVSADSMPPIQLRMFAEALPLQRTRIDTSAFGRLKVTYNQNPRPLLRWDSTDAAVATAFDRDTFLLWHDAPEPWTILLSTDSLYHDTLSLRAAEPALAADRLPALQLRDATSRPRKQLPGRSYALDFNLPLRSLDTSLVQVLADTTLTPTEFTWEVDSVDQRRLLLKAPWREATPYQLLILPGAVTDWWGRFQPDSIQQSFTIEERKRFGTLHVEISGADSSMTYLVKLVDKNQQVINTYSLNGVSGDRRSFSLLPPGDYHLEVIQDLNGNGRWDPGHYDSQRLPEPVRQRQLEQLRANWELEATVDLATLFLD